MAPSEKQVVYSHTVKAFIEHVSANPRAIELIGRLRGLGIDPAAPRDLPPETWWKVIEAAAATLYPELPQEEGVEQVGRAALQGFGESLVGRTAFMVLRLLGPKRGLLRIAEQIRMADSVSSITPEVLDDRKVQLHFVSPSGYMYPTYLRGLLLEGMKRIGVKATITVEFPDQHTCQVMVTW